MQPMTLRDLESLIETPEVSHPRVYVCPSCGLTFADPREHDTGRCALSEVKRGQA